jgi:NADH-quinone oxidoreductase subunit L
VSFLRLLWLIPLLPAAGFVINGLFGRRFLSRRMVGTIACGTVLLAFLISAGAVSELAGLKAEGGPEGGTAAGMTGASAVRFERDGLRVDPSIPAVRQTLWDWIDAGRISGGTASLTVRWGYALDPLSGVMLLIVTGVGFLIHVYSLGYMAHDDGHARFFAYLNLFMAMMLVLVLADSFPVLFVGWEGVGLCSYLLIGFHTRDMFDEARGMSCADAGRKAFLVNRIGDFGFLLGMLLILVTFGTLDFESVFTAARAASSSAVPVGLFTAMALLLFVGATGKSAQIPLHVWLPDAMAGPTPVSALIHAATMVTAGVYMVCRCAALFLLAPAAMETMALIGAGTALLAAVIGMVQFDIKKVLAYSTVSQLGFMFLAAGVGAFGIAIFHVMTHAFFKALLFLGAGSVIHALGGEQDTRRMGGLRRALPWTFATFLIATLAIAGVPPLSGFFSKDGILSAVFFSSGKLWLLAAGTAGLTAFYMGRLLWLTFLTDSRLDDEKAGHLHEAPWSMRLPLVVLAVLAVVGGFLGVPAPLTRWMPFLGVDRLDAWLEPVFARAGRVPPLEHTADNRAAAELSLMGVSVLIGLLGLSVAWSLYGRVRGRELIDRFVDTAGGAYRLALDCFRVDALYERVILRPFRFLCRLSDAFDRFVVDLTVNVVGIAVQVTGHALKLLQTGSVRTYALSFLCGAVLLAWFLVGS